MLKKIVSLILALAALFFALPAGAGGAGDLNDYAICSFSRSFPVYTGPGEEYFRVDGSAKYGSGSCSAGGAGNIYFGLLGEQFGNHLRGRRSGDPQLCSVGKPAAAG